MLDKLNKRYDELIQKYGCLSNAFLGLMGLAILIALIHRDNNQLTPAVMNIAAGFVTVALAYFVLQSLLHWNPNKLGETIIKDLLDDLRFSLKTQTEANAESLKNLATQASKLSENMESQFEQHIKAVEASAKELDYQLRSMDKVIRKAAHDIRKIDVFEDKTSLYAAATKTLKSRKWARVRIFAPVGIWKNEPEKKIWLKELAEYARNSGVKEMVAIFGLPPYWKDTTVLDKKLVFSDLAETKKALSLFKGISSIQIHYTYPSSFSMGIGIVLFEEYPKRFGGKVAIAFASKSAADSVDMAFTLGDEGQFQDMCLWFDRRLLSDQTKMQSIPTKPEEFEKKWKQIRNWYENWYNNPFRIDGFAQSHLVGEDSILREIERLCSGAHGIIRGYLVGGVKSATSWTETVAKRLREAKDLGNTVTFRSVIAVNLEQLPSTFVNDIDERAKIYEELGVQGQTELYLLDQRPPVGIDFVTIDDRSLMLILPPPIGENKNQVYRAIAFENREDLVRDYVQYFDNSIMFLMKDRLIEYNDWKRRTSLQ